MDVISQGNQHPQTGQYIEANTTGGYSLGRKFEDARTAFLARDVEGTSICNDLGYAATAWRAHQRRDLDTPYEQLVDGHHESHNTTSGEYFKAFIFGGLDGILTIFAIVSGSMGAKVSPLIIVIIGIGNLLADAVSMGFGEYVSATAETAFVKAEREREEWEVENCPTEEKDEMIEIYTKKYHFTFDDAQKLVDITFKYREFFIQHMMVEELNLTMEDENGSTPLKRAMVMFGSFCTFGIIPLAGFIVWQFVAGTGSASSGLIGFLIAIVCSLITLFVLGVFKGLFVNQSPFKSGLLMVLNGTIAENGETRGTIFIAHLNAGSWINLM
ncbi:putative integral membrane protein [Cardiosporidium cionae]|uniref:Integral membrane protein n=1 Tax=Cardiosporidium cionae TaxID=476202 RepID=A0ABQ7JFI0_9APIC|nr:putative integral membrane protein [Cardiosporidium cionae]|eukprot:KAF8822630.1 putative integral membrane protein [Cardiosporidium cionae]